MTGAKNADHPKLEWDNPLYTLEIFEGPLPFLLHLIQKSEIDIHDIPIQEITSQYLDRLDIHFKGRSNISPLVDSGAEFIGIASLLLWMKSKRLLPKHEGEEGQVEDLDPHFEILYKILEYCQFKETAQSFGLREEEQTAFFTRGIHSLPEPKKRLGIEHLTQEDLASLFRKILEKAQGAKERIQEDPWKVSDKMETIQILLQKNGRSPFSHLFSSCQSKGELIVTFLALLELMKIGTCFVGKEEGEGGEEREIFVYIGSYEEKTNGK